MMLRPKTHGLGFDVMWMKSPEALKLGIGKRPAILRKIKIKKEEKIENNTLEYTNRHGVYVDICSSTNGTFTIEQDNLKRQSRFPCFSCVNFICSSL